MLLIDGQNLAYREAFAKAGLSHNGQPTGAIFGFLQQLRRLTSRYQMEICFCWDSKQSKRKEFYPDYKANRHKDGVPEEVQQVYGQIEILQNDLLPRLGYPNQHTQDGYEADDLIAALCSRYSGPHVIVSSDNDLFQLLGPSTSIYNLGKKGLMTYKDFQTEYGVTPMQWVEVKSLAGDTSDNIPGIKGVGIKTAVKHLTNGNSLKLAQKIGKEYDVVARNRVLVKLPWEGTEPGPVRESAFNEREFLRVCGEFGLNSLIRKN